MRNYKFVICLSVLVLAIQPGFSQGWKTGDKAEAYINNGWKEVTIIKKVADKNTFYEVKPEYRDAGKKNLQVNKNNLRTISLVTGSGTVSAVNEEGPHLGRYDLYSGTPAVYLGHLVLLAAGKYKLAFSTDEDNYEAGNYVFHPGSKSIEWLTGMFHRKGWDGKLIYNGTSFRIQFAKTTYAETN